MDIEGFRDQMGVLGNIGDGFLLNAMFKLFDKDQYCAINFTEYIWGLDHMFNPHQIGNRWLLAFSLICIKYQQYQYTVKRIRHKNIMAVATFDSIYDDHEEVLKKFEAALEEKLSNLKKSNFCDF